MEFSTKTLEFEKCVIRAQLWDTAGHERFDSMTKAYFRDAVGACIVFDITNRQTFQNVKSRWLQRLHDHGHEGMKMVLGKLSPINSRPRRVFHSCSFSFAIYSWE